MTQQICAVNSSSRRGRHSSAILAAILTQQSDDLRMSSNPLRALRRCDRSRCVTATWLSNLEAMPESNAVFFSNFIMVDLRTLPTSSADYQLMQLVKHYIECFVRVVVDES